MAKFFWLTFFVIILHNKFLCAQETSNLEDDSLTLADTMVKGPVSVDICGKATLAVPEGYFYAPRTVALERMLSGKISNPQNLIGTITPYEAAKIMYVIKCDNIGHVNDQDVAFDAAVILEQIQNDAKPVNQQRTIEGLEKVVPVSWAFEPSYNKTAHRLDIALAMHTENPDIPDYIQGGSYTLIKEGLISVDSMIAGLTPPERGFVSNWLTVNSGQKYSDYDKKTDFLSGYKVRDLFISIPDSDLDKVRAAVNNGYDIPDHDNQRSITLITLCGFTIAAAYLLWRWMRRRKM